MTAPRDTRARDPLSRGHALRLAGKFPAALVAYGRAEDQAETPLELADALVGQAMTLRGMALYENAIVFADAALHQYRQAGDREGEAFALYCRGGARRFLGIFSEAGADLERSLLLTKDATAKRFTLMALGGLRRMQGQFGESLVLYANARRIAVRARDSYATAYADCGIGNAWRMKREWVKARNHLEAALAGYRAIRDRVSSPYTRFALALLELAEPSSGSPRALQRAMLHVTRARNAFTATGDRRGIVYADLADAVIARTAGRNADARRLASRAVRAAQALGLAYEAAHAVSLRDGAAKARPLYKALSVPPPASPLFIP